MNIRRIVFSAVVGGSVLLGAPGAFAATHATTIKAGSPCTKKEVNKTTKVGKTTFVCKADGKKYEWTVKK